MTPLSASYAYCRRIARARARNFYYSFLLLSPQQRDAMCAIYAFMRVCDDLSDGPDERPQAPSPDPQARQAALLSWRRQLHDTLSGSPAPHPLWPALADAVARFRIPHHYLDTMIDGVLSDLHRVTIRDFDELDHYCYQVAGVVGLTIIHIFGFQSPDALPLAEKCGLAFQLTNIMRDVREDALRGRCYLPQSELTRFQVSPLDLAAARYTPGFFSLMEEISRRAAACFAAAPPLVALIHPRSRRSLHALIAIYYRLFHRIRQSGFRVLHQRIALSPWEKSWIMISRGLGLAGSP